MIIRVLGSPVHTIAGALAFVMYGAFVSHQILARTGATGEVASIVIGSGTGALFPAASTLSSV
jgi:hypothetical protein